jgi:hypothetical protein
LMGDQALGELEQRLGRTLRPGKRPAPFAQARSETACIGVNGKVSS